MTVSVGKAGPEAFEQAAPLLERFFAEEGFTTPPETIRARLRSFLADPSCAAFLAWERETAVGIATISTTFGIEYGRSAEMDDLYVLPEARGRGVARALIEQVQTWCRHYGCTVLLLTITPEGQEAHDLTEFYLRLGFEDHGRRLLSVDLTGPEAAGAS